MADVLHHTYLPFTADQRGDPPFCIFSGRDQRITAAAQMTLLATNGEVKSQARCATRFTGCPPAT
jgi:hypothetical protein